MKLIETTGNFKTIVDTDLSTVPEGCALVPDTMDTTAFYQYNGCVTLSVENGVVTAIIPNVAVWEAWKTEQPDPAIALAEEVRTQRDKLLTACDWTQVADCPLSDTMKASWQVYRQALRDVPEQEGFPNDVVWPDKPE